MERKPHPTDLTDEQWLRLAPYLPPPKSGGPKGGRPQEVDPREAVNALFYHARRPAARVPRRRLAPAAARLPALVHRLRLLPPLAGRRHLGADPRPPPGGRAPGGRAAADAQRRRRRQPDREDHPPGRPPRLRRGEKKSPGGSGTCWWTRWGWSGPWSSPPPASRTRRGRGCS